MFNWTAPIKRRAPLSADFLSEPQPRVISLVVSQSRKGASCNGTFTSSFALQRLQHPTFIRRTSQSLHCEARGIAWAYQQSYRPSIRRPCRQGEAFATAAFVTSSSIGGSEVPQEARSILHFCSCGIDCSLVTACGRLNTSLGHETLVVLLTSDSSCYISCSDSVRETPEQPQEDIVPACFARLRDSDTTGCRLLLG